MLKKIILWATTFVMWMTSTIPVMADPLRITQGGTGSEIGAGTFSGIGTFLFKNDFHQINISPSTPGVLLISADNDPSNTLQLPSVASCTGKMFLFSVRSLSGGASTLKVKAFNGETFDSGTDTIQIANNTTIATGNSLVAYVISDGTRWIGLDSRVAGGVLSFPIDVSLGGTGLTSVGASGTILNSTGSGIQYSSPAALNLLTLAGGTLSGDLDLDGNRVLGLPSVPGSPTDAVSSQYVDGLLQGLKTKDSCRVTTIANITLSGEQTIDTIPVVTGDRVLVKDQTNAEDNGVYVVDSGPWVRSTDADSDSDIEHMYTLVVEGDQYPATGWVLTNETPITLGVTDLNYTRFSIAGQLSGGTGIDVTGTQVSLETPVTVLNGGTGNNYGGGLFSDGTATTDTTGTVVLSATSAGLRRSDTSGGNITYNLPVASSCAGKIFSFFKLSGFNTSFVQPNTGDKIEGNVANGAQTISSAGGVDGTISIISNGIDTWSFLQKPINGAPANWTQGGVVYGSDRLRISAAGTSGQPLLSGAAGAPTFGTLTVPNGGTGSTTASGARTNLGAAASGANSDITSLTGLTGANEINLSSDVVGLKIKGHTTQTTALNITDSANNSIFAVLGNNAGNVTSAYKINTYQDLTITTGHVKCVTLGKTLSLKTGANGSRGTGTLVAGTVTIANTSITANSIVLINRTGGTLSLAGDLWENKAARVNGVSFQVDSLYPLAAGGTTASTTDDATFDYVIIEGN